VNTFAESLERGAVGETALTKWLNSKGWSVLPAYEKVENDNKGPRIFSPDGQIISPDLLAFQDERAIWVEAKTKSAFTWHRNTSTWVTGIDRHHYKEYLRIGKYSHWPLWILFIQESGVAKDSPEGSPTGLFGGEINMLSQNIHHEHANWGRHGMVYWGTPPLRRICGLGGIP
jgi:hypothetical protein